ncbi:MAG TPA: cytochrome c [Candidatus Acidoferrum sp.]|jgi:mono/diheme cytochrome c family protein
MRVLTSLCALCLAFALSGCRATPPGKWETATLNRIKRSITVHGKSAKNPLPETPENIKDGQAAFSHYCMACHGLDGQNTGVPFSDNMSPPVPSLRSSSVQSYKDGQLKWIIENGIWPSGMPASKGILTDEEMWAIVDYIRHLPPAGSLGDPPCYSTE